MIRIFDTHAHYDDEAFDKDCEELLKSFPEHNVMAVTNIGTNIDISRITAQLTEQYDYVYGAVGMYPTEVYAFETSDAMEQLRSLVTEHERVVAIGEIGLDYHYDNIDKALQQKWFEAQMNLARELNVPIVVHSRDAAQDTIAVMRQAKAGEIGGVVHCYSYTKETAREFLDMDFYFGIGGVVTFKNAKKLVEAVAYIPMERMVLETDSPYLSPIRSERNTSLNLPLVAAKIAEIKGISVQEVYDITWENAHKLYKIKERTQETGR